MLSDTLSGQIYMEMQAETWQSATRIYYDLRKQGLTVRSPIDCCIAQLAIENAMLQHKDRDFVTISQVVPLQQKKWTFLLAE